MLDLARIKYKFLNQDVVKSICHEEMPDPSFKHIKLKEISC